jgi:hypothetical protein
MTFVPFHHADSIGDRFLALLDKCGIDPPNGSSFEDELLSLTQLMEVAKNPNLVQGKDQLTMLRAAAGVHDFAAKVLSVEPLPEFPAFIPHLRLIAQTKFAAASLSQNAQMAELYLGCLAAHVGTQVDLDSPTNAKGDNPDVIFTVQTDDPQSVPEKWALAIKTISSKHGQTIFDRIAEGAGQIDDPKCPAERGLVVINTKNALDHDALWGTVFPTADDAMVALRAQLTVLADSAARDRDAADWDALFQGKVARPVLFLGQSLVRVVTPSARETPTALKMLFLYDAAGVIDPVAHGLAAVMNDFMQTILHGVPGNQGQRPS